MQVSPEQTGLAPRARVGACGATPIRVAIPNLDSYVPESGIGRVLWSLIACWGNAIEMPRARFHASTWPVLRNFPSGVTLEGTGQADIILLPRLTGAQSLRQTRGLPGVVTVHDVGFIDFPGDRAGMSLISRLSVMQSIQGLRSANTIITDSVFTQQRLTHYMPEIACHVQVIHAGVSESFLGHEQHREDAWHMIRSYTGHSPGSPLLIYVGSELPRKNIAVLLEAFRHVRQHHPGAMLLKVGQAGHPRWRARTLDAARRLGLAVGRDMVIVEDLDDHELAAAYRAADVFITASLYEGFGLPALEAMAIGTPVVVTDRGALPEIVGEAGLVVPPDARALAAAVDQALRYRREADLRSRAARFTWTRAAQRYLELFRALTDSSR